MITVFHETTDIYLNGHQSNNVAFSYYFSAKSYFPEKVEFCEYLVVVFNNDTEDIEIV